jgi:hypothetical protein
MAVTLPTAVVMMIAAEAIIASVALMDTVVEVKPLFTTKARPRNGLSTIQAFHLGTLKFSAELFLLAA